jgi:hypothetical protein
LTRRGGLLTALSARQSTKRSFRSMSDTTSLTPPLSRNARCPCGSGKRYKDCHGALVDQSPGLRFPDEPTRRRLDAALAAQRAGRLAEAAARYEAIVAEQPDLFDALHMLGVTHYQLGDFERAQELVVSALRMSPADRPARHNLQLIESVLERRGVEREICRQTLPRLARRCVAAPASSDDGAWRHAAFDLIVARADAFDRQGIVERLSGWLRPASLTVWLYPAMTKPAAAAWPVRVIDADTLDIPDRSRAIFVGADRSPATWYEHSPATDVALYCDDESPRILLDRIPELSREGRTPLRLLFAGAAQAGRIGLPGVIVPAAAPRP